MSVSVWIDSGNDARGDLKSKYGITDPYFDGRWLAAKGQPVALRYLESLKATGYNPGIYLCSQGEGWPNANDTPPADWSDWAYVVVQNNIAPGTSGSFPKVHLNCETHDPDWIRLMLKRWRSHSPKRETALLIEGMQGGWYKKIAAQVAALGISVYAEAFNGPMRRSESSEVLRDLMLAGVPWQQAGVVLDAAQMGDWWNGTQANVVAFTQGRLPA